MSEYPFAVLLADLVDSTQLTQQLGDERAAQVWQGHDQMARELVLECNGREIDKSDGFLLLFDASDDALRFARRYHLALAGLEPALSARVGIHVGALQWRENPPGHVARGAKPVEVDGLAKSIAARIMGLANAGQTLISAAACNSLGEGLASQERAIGLWRFKGTEDALELFMDADGTCNCDPPGDGPKAWRVTWQAGLVVPVREVPHSLPAERDRFVGRASALYEVMRVFREGCRLVCLFGAGGAGKTRLSVRLGWQQLGEFEGGIWFCDLSAARSIDGIARATAEGLRIKLADSGDAIDRIGEAIANRGECLLIIDNFEQVASDAEATLGRWLARAPRACFLVATRELLGIVGEHALELPPLSQADGVALLRERARTVGAASLSEDDLAALPRLADLLDGLPLAIELAASRMRVLSATQLLSRMGERFRLLSSSRGRHDRQATMRATLDWSWDLLSLSERLALAQLSVFEGGFTLTAAEAVVRLPNEADDRWAPGFVQALVEKSLVRRAAGSRFGLLRSIQEYASEQLDRSERWPGDLRLFAAGAQERHWLYFASLDEPGITDEPFLDPDNLVVALPRAVRAGRWDAATQLLGHCSAALLATGPAALVIALSKELMQSSALSPKERAAACRAVGNSYYMIGQTEDAADLLEEGLTLATDQGDDVQSVRLRCALAEVRIRRGEHALARELLDAALEEAQRQRNPRLEYLTLNRIGVMLLERGDFAASEQRLQEALQTARGLGHRRWEGGLLGNLGLAAHALGRIDQATRCFRECISIAQSFGDLQWSANARCNLAFLLLESGAAVDAEREFRAVLRVSREIGHSTLTATALCNLGLCCLAQERADEAASALREAAETAERIGARRLEAESRRHLASALIRCGEFADARQQANVAGAIASLVGWASEADAAGRLLDELDLQRV